MEEGGAYLHPWGEAIKLVKKLFFNRNPGADRFLWLLPCRPLLPDRSQRGNLLSDSRLCPGHHCQLEREQGCLCTGLLREKNDGVSKKYDFYVFSDTDEAMWRTPVMASCSEC